MTDEMCGIRSSNRYCNRINKDQIDKIKCAKNIIQDLEHHGPGGLIHISVLSNIIGKPIHIWNADGSLNRIIGKKKTGRPIDIEYHATESKQIGHWTLKYGKDPDNIAIDLNSCLFSVIGSQIGQNPSELRKWTVLKLKSNPRRLTNQIDNILRLEENGEIILMIGGARYHGTSPSHARVILDGSQNQRCHAFPHLGHPRGHASHPSGYDNVENYSIGSNKTGFLSRVDQDYVTHLALRTKKAQNAMADLNRGRTTIEITVCPEEMMNLRNNLPKAREYHNQVPITEERDIRDVVLVLRHHDCQFNNPDADVFVQTCFPRI